MSFPYLLIFTYVNENVPFYPKENAYGTEYTTYVATQHNCTY